jgi:hypothetical protein
MGYRGIGGEKKSARRSRVELCHGNLMLSLAYKALVHREGNGDARIGIAIRPIAGVALGERVNRDSV